MRNAWLISTCCRRSVYDQQHCVLPGRGPRSRHELRGRLEAPGSLHGPGRELLVFSRGLESSADHSQSSVQFDNLDEGVQSEFETYLEERGVNSALALFIPDLAEWKEQKCVSSYLRARSPCSRRSLTRDVPCAQGVCPVARGHQDLPRAVDCAFFPLPLSLRESKIGVNGIP